jgi:hypothetical protein
MDGWTKIHRTTHLQGVRGSANFVSKLMRDVSIHLDTFRSTPKRARSRLHATGEEPITIALRALGDSRMYCWNSYQPPQQHAKRLHTFASHRATVRQINGLAHNPSGVFTGMKRQTLKRGRTYRLRKPVLGRWHVDVEFMMPYGVRVAVYDFVISRPM